MKPEMLLPISSKIFTTAAMMLLTSVTTPACSQPAAPATKADTSAITAPRPDWMAALIATYEREPVANPARRIIRFKFENKTVYYLPPICCDIPSRLLDADGQMLCSPDGGFTGRGDGRCPDFHKARREEQLMWQDSRAWADTKKPQ